MTKPNVLHSGAPAGVTPAHRYRLDLILDEHEHLCEIRLAIGETVMIVNDFKLLTVQSEELETYAYTAEVGYV